MGTKQTKTNYIIFRVSASEKKIIKSLAKLRRTTISGLFMSLIDTITKQ